MIKKKRSKPLPTTKNATSSSKRFFYFLLILIAILLILNVAKVRGWLIPIAPMIEVQDQTIFLDDLTIEQKVAQMIVVHGGIWNMAAWKNLQVGGIHFFALENEQLYQDYIAQYQQDSVIPFFVTADLEGCLNPFANFHSSEALSSIRTVAAAEQKGMEDGRFLTQLGFNVNFAPVVDLNDQIWGCRSLLGDEQTVTELAQAYVKGLQSQNIIATAKHYPGRTLEIKDPHKQLVFAEIGSADLYPYQQLHDVKGVMVSHLIVSGAVDSEGVPAVVSSKTIIALKQNFSGLIVSDEINMLGLRKFYSSEEQMYVDLFKAGNDLILNFNDDPNEIYQMIKVVSAAVETGEIPEERIDASVKKILELKGFTVV